MGKVSLLKRRDKRGNKRIFKAAPSCNSNINSNTVLDFSLKKKKQKHSIYCRNVFKTQSKFYDGTFLQK